ncbi:MAG: glycerol-3-phosphate 1-O-acyltransferase PlsY [Alphaproteobacteria bacterium]|nr:glycerol-3-phosphate 1-O-acyltransferase PlsY [Alphaproteobacteria bacterium]
MTSAIFICCVLGYLAGSIPFGLVLTMASGLGDIRKIGSGNIGATNVLRTGRKDLALLTLIFDVAKAGFIALLCADLFDSQTMGLLAGTMAVLGHNFPIWLHFKGGKGVASTLGLMLAMTPVAGVLTCLTWLGMAMVKHYSSLSALTALALAPLYAWIFNSGTAALFYLALTLLSFYRHRANIQRLWQGTETKIDLKKKAEKKKK